MTAPLLAGGLSRAFVPEGCRVVALDDVSLSPAPGGDALTPGRLRRGGGGTMAVPLIVAAGLSRTLPASRRLAGPDDMSLAAGDAFRFSPPLVGPRFREAGS
jgi:hypothetical protein